MIGTIALFEFRKRLRQMSTYIYFAIFFALSFFVAIVAGGALPAGNLVIAGSGGKTMVNSPFVLCMLISSMSYFGLLVTSAIMGNAVYQDFHFRTYPFFFTSPISTFTYLMGRFTGAVLVLLVIFASIGLGFWLGSLMPFVDASNFGPNRLIAYVQPYLIIVLPNLIITGALFFSLAALVRKILPVYVTSVVLLIGYLIASVLTEKLEWKYLAAIVDPFGMNAAALLTEYWTVSERNSLLVPLAGALLVNRAVWLGLSVQLLAVTYWQFRRSEAGFESRPRGTRTTQRPLAAPVVLPATQRNYGSLRLLPELTWLAFMETVKNVYFAVIVLAGVLFMIVTSLLTGAMFGTETYPVTAQVITIIGGSFSLFMLIIITFYAGELVWRERDVGVNQLMDVLPLPNWLPLVSKLLALILVQVLLMFVILLTCLAIQTFQGYFKFELPVYLQDLFLLKLPRFALVCVLAITVQVLVNQKYVGHFVMVLYYLSTSFMGSLGFEHNLYDYASTPGYVYSDMNGFGHFTRAIRWFDAYWAAGAVLLAIVSNLFWVRGTEQDFFHRLQLAKARTTPLVKGSVAVAACLFIGLGGTIYYNTNVLNTYKTGHQRELEAAQYEKDYKHLQQTPQPRVTDVKLAIDIDPPQRNVRAQGTLTLTNRTNEPIPTIYVHVLRDLVVHDLSIGPVKMPTPALGAVAFYTFTLPEPLAPAASVDLEFSLELLHRGFRNSGGGTEVVYNGTFFNSSVFPHIGYDSNYELGEDNRRKKFGLEPKERMADLDDLPARQNNYISSQADWISLDATVSTSPDQIAIVPGYLQRQWTADGKRYFHYRTDGQILDFFSVLSARYEVRRDTWHGPVAFGRTAAEKSAAAPTQKPDMVGEPQDVAIEIYYHAGHEYNIDGMVKAIKDSLDYYTKNFGPYQHRQVRIIEFPRYQSFAQSFPNTIPYSEGVGFVARVDPQDPDDIDYPYYITAHEIAHQWWAHQVIGGNVQGATMLSETMAQYSALMVMKGKFGPDQMRRFLSYELNQYLMGRATERKKELPLYRNENQGYIHYNKGSLVMYALQDYLGEETLNKAIAAYLQKVAYQDPPYTSSAELIAEIRKVTPPDLAYLIEDLFETITLFDNRAVSATYTDLGKRQYEVKVKVDVKKLRADELGVESELPLADLIDIGVLDDQGKVLVLEKKHIDASPAEFTFTVNRVPAKAGIDPLNILIDRRPDDNTMRVVKEE